jgi:hypothetical protein
MECISGTVNCHIDERNALLYHTANAFHTSLAITELHFFNLREFTVKHFFHLWEFTEMHFFHLWQFTVPLMHFLHLWQCTDLSSLAIHVMLFSSLAIYCKAFLLSGSETKKLPTAESYCESFLADFLFHFRSYFLRKLFCRRKLHINSTYLIV